MTSALEITAILGHRRRTRLCDIAHNMIPMARLRVSQIKTTSEREVECARLATYADPFVRHQFWSTSELSFGVVIPQVRNSGRRPGAARWPG